MEAYEPSDAANLVKSMIDVATTKTTGVYTLTDNVTNTSIPLVFDNDRVCSTMRFACFAGE